MADIIELKATDLAAMLCSRVCHDLINPIGAIGNGLEVLADPNQGDMADGARDLIASAAKQSRAKLEFARLAYGASSTSGTDIDTRECERVARIQFDIEKAELDWQVPLILLPKHKAKLFMNMLLIAAGSVPRGGLVTAKISGAAGEERFEFTSRSDPEKRQKTLVPAGTAGLLSGMPDEGSVDARGIQPFYTGLLARMTDMEINIGIENAEFFFTAIPKSKDAAVETPATEAIAPEAPAAVTTSPSE
ncbi:histidine phosphotransferase family protein [Devosia sp. FJ2-5-3]|jgi:histidine phosphotransferase ChpT|uniref:histidine phosphotransferase family protein n=1 Tax=Devosia sp. FJ2-5-3 TaxID=2976680 RepID=UPI0023D83EAB|nr:histidine phosphotransferase family protein [Devosia sp. FJ2-5-3]WEJ57972.1 histidine phosphotransferase family protein [Devosia sp. FJ2-5-3]